jgi:hypothetical protein
MLYLFKFLSVDNQKLGIAIAIGAISVGISNKFMSGTYKVHHAATSVVVGIIAATIAYQLVPASKPKPPIKVVVV